MNDETRTILKAMDDLSKRLRNLEAVELLVPGTTVLTRTTQAIPDSAWTTISFATGVVGNGFDWTIGDPTNTYFIAARNTQRVLLSGRIQWASFLVAPAPKSLAIRYVATRPAGTDTVTLQASIISGLQIIQSWACPLVFDSADMYTSIIFQVYQNTGAPLDVEAITAGLFYIR